MELLEALGEKKSHTEVRTAVRVVQREVNP